VILSIRWLGINPLVTVSAPKAGSQDNNPPKDYHQNCFSVDFRHFDSGLHYEVKRGFLSSLRRESP
jgi:hypothetical protein